MLGTLRPHADQAGADHAGNVEEFMNGRASIPTLRIGLIGSGFIANFHLQALLSVRHVVVSGVYSPTTANRAVLWNSARAGRFRRSKPC
jgi:ornithine cyclodeaminase/alanine dehydrogenase-like protein (mu-crystallin family)